jgi:hypothetical protein
MVHERAEPDVQVAERRQHVRYAEENRVHFLEIEQSAKAHEGRLRDLSAGGLCLHAEREFSVGTRLCLGIFFEHRRDDPLMVLAEVRHCRPDADGFTMGLKFVPGTDEQQGALRSIQAYLVARHGD